MRVSILSLALLGSLTLAVPSAYAATVDLSATYTATDANIHSRNIDGDPTADTFYTGGALGVPGTVGVNDNFTLTYLFGGNGVSGSVDGAQIYAYDTQNTDLLQLLNIVGTMSFLDSLGNAIKSVAVNVEEGNLSIGTSLFFFFDTISTPIYGVAFSGTITDGTQYPSGDAAVPRLYDGGYVQLLGHDLAIAPTAAVPLPAGLPLLAAGVGALGFLGWRKKRSGAAVAAA